MKYPERGNITNIQSKESNIKERIEDYFFDRMIAYESIGNQQRFIVTRKSNAIPTKDGRGCAYTIADLSKGYNEKELQYFMSYFLHIVEEGYASICTDASATMNVVGYSQFISSEFLVFVIKRSRYYLYFRMLHIIRKVVCLENPFKTEDFLNKKVKEIIKDFGTKKGIDTKIIYELINLEKALEEIEQKPEYWDFNTLDSINNIDEYNKKRIEKKQLEEECQAYVDPKGVWDIKSNYL